MTFSTPQLVHRLGQLYLFESCLYSFLYFQSPKPRYHMNPTFLFLWLITHFFSYSSIYVYIHASIALISSTYQGQIFPLMASKQFVLILLLLIHLVPHLGNGAKYIIHRLTHHHHHHHKCHKNCHHHHESAHPPKFRFPPKNPKPVPPSGPSSRHNIWIYVEDWFLKTNNM